LINLINLTNLTNLINLLISINFHYVPQIKKHKTRI
jgi:hypothetical protein